MNSTLSIEEGCAVLSLNRPPVNALSTSFLSEVKETVEQCAINTEIRVLVIASKLGKVFSAGADIEQIKNLDASESTEFSRQGQEVCSLLESLPKPVIAAVSGVAFGGGCELALSCDLRVAGSSSSFALPEINLGIIPGWGGTQRLSRLVGKAGALEIMMTGKPITAARAWEMGLVNRVVGNDEVLNEALRTGVVLATKSPKSLALIKEAVHRGMSLPTEESFELERCLFEKVRGSKDAQEGIEAFLEKRQPRFQDQ